MIFLDNVSNAETTTMNNIFVFEIVAVAPYNAVGLYIITRRLKKSSTNKWKKNEKNVSLIANILIGVVQVVQI